MPLLPGLSTELVLDAIRGRGHVLVLPYPNHAPPSFAQPLVSIAITSSVPFELLAPPISVVLRPRPVLRAAVPIAAIHEHGDSMPGENNIRPAPQALQRRIVDSEPQGAPMELGAQPHLGGRVPLSCSGHPRADRCRLGLQILTRHVSLLPQRDHAATTARCSSTARMNPGSNLSNLSPLRLVR